MPGKSSARSVWHGKVNSVVSAINTKRLLQIHLLLVGLFVYSQVVALLVFSFNSGGITFPFVDITLDWYNEVLQSGAFSASFVNSVKLAAAVTVVVTVLSTGSALAFRHRFRGKNLIIYLFLLGIVTPGIMYGIGITVFLGEVVGLKQGLWLGLPVHVIWAFPFSFILFLAGMPPNLTDHEEAARVFGANDFEVAYTIILPEIKFQVFGAAVFAFTLSYNELDRSLLLLGTDNTMPLEVYSVASRDPTPGLAALGSLTSTVSIVVLILSFALILYGRSAASSS